MSCLISKVPESLAVTLTLCMLYIFVSFSLPIEFENQNIINQVTAQNNPTSSNFVTYNGSKYGLTIDYPTNWNKTEDATGVWFFSPVDQTGNIRIQSEPKLNTTLANLVKAQFIILQETHKEVDVLSSNITTVDGNTANRTDYKFKDEIPKFLGADIFDYTAFQVTTVKNDKLYTFIYFSTPDKFDIFLPIAQKMLGTIKIS